MMLAAQKPQQVRTHRFPRKTLLWKELSENKAQVAWSSSILIVLMMGVSLLNFINGNQADPVNFHNNALGLLILTWCLSASITSSSMISPELNGSRLQFLTSLPVRRSTIWWTKLASALTLHILSIVATTIIFMVVFSRDGAPANNPSGLPLHVISSLNGLSWYSPLLSLLVFSVGSVVTMFTDRTLSAFFASVLISAVEATELLLMQSSLDSKHIASVIAITMAATVVQLAISHKIFVNGETLATSKRLTLYIDSVAFDLLPVIIALVVAYFWISD